MSEIFITKIKINQLRKLHNISLELDNDERKHLIITGKNGSGKTTLLVEMKRFLAGGGPISEYLGIKSQMAEMGPHRHLEHLLANYKTLEINLSNEKDLRTTYDNGNLVFAFFPAQRNFAVEPTINIEKFQLPHIAHIDQRLSDKLLKYLIFLRSMLTDAYYSKKIDEVSRLESWFKNFEKVLQEIFSDRELKLEYDSQNLTFYLLERGRDKIDFNSLSDGYAAVIRIVTELMMRMENKAARVYDIQGIALIDEIETHLHIELQRTILPFLTTFFPRIQFIVTTHSPFILNSIDNAVVFDLENKIKLEEPSEISSLALVEKYFMVNADYSATIENKIKEFERLVQLENRTESDDNRLADLLVDLDTLSPTLSPEMYLRFKSLEQQIKEKQV